MNQFKQFMTAEDGAVTVDWVVLTAAVVGLGFAVIATIQAGAIGQANSIDTALEERCVSVVVCPPSGG